MREHCSVFALSDKTANEFRQQCDHDHDERCAECDAIVSTLKDTEELLSRASYPSNDDREEALYLFRTAQRAIHNWKCHQLRSVQQDKARLDVVDILDDNTVFVVIDWAMKFLPQRYRESQTDWFGKRGVSWHISVVYRRVLGELQSQGFIHIVQSCNQDSAAVITIMQHVLDTLATEHPNIRKAFFRQDNAGCYHSAATLLAFPSIEASTGINVAGVDFSDPQGGKGAADRMAAAAKSHIRMYINEGHDVTNAEQMKDALLSYGGLEGVRVAAVECLEEHSISGTQQKIPGISKLNNFRFSEGNLLARRAYGIGSGKEIPVNVSTMTGMGSTVSYFFFVSCFFSMVSCFNSASRHYLNVRTRLMVSYYELFAAVRKNVIGKAFLKKRN